MSHLNYDEQDKLYLPLEKPMKKPKDTRWIVLGLAKRTRDVGGGHNLYILRICKTKDAALDYARTLPRAVRPLVTCPETLHECFVHTSVIEKLAE